MITTGRISSEMLRKAVKMQIAIVAHLLHQQGFIKPDDLEGIPLEFGNANGLLEWVRKIAYGEGLGAKMALGPKHLADTFGAVKLSMTAKKSFLLQLLNYPIILSSLTP